MSTSKQPIDQIADSATAATEKVADRAERAVDATRAFANEALDKANAKVHSLREDVQPAIDALSARVHDMAARGKAVAADTTAQTREKLGEVTDKTSAYVAEKPLQSMAIAAAAGAVLALLLGRRR
ncbi:hypothetical protein [Ottowia sp.]|jgi:ElaB/YqjD/DUF883 family membrane-anchored ribosome-binding protein|uniref:glycine zipper domain-containing protein n=1 Tax=Ottowia sp. TaxID=1898956 RepID=UPI0025FFCE71|nr:hypothetical protein [Ottowia sp.]MBK6615529.1 DUF883 family protein [Ottowia sp.]MBK6746599.1 DUF883 family protein [Ottowia sp.]